MITAVDTNVLVDVLGGPGSNTERSAAALAGAVDVGSLIVSDVVYAKLAVRLSLEDLERFLTRTRIERVSSSAPALHLAGRTWSTYLSRRPDSFVCSACGASNPLACGRCGSRIASRQHLLPDFIIGAHALFHADRLLTRDHGYYRTYFPDLELA